MGPEIGFGAGRLSGGRPRPSLFVRLLEIAGLAVVFAGLLMGEYWLIPLGAVTVVASYTIYRRKHGSVLLEHNQSDGGSDSDSGGGD